MHRAFIEPATVTATNIENPTDDDGDDDDSSGDAKKD